eukprot:3359727-Pleurochrysis_carterae.AAC.2
MVLLVLLAIAAVGRAVELLLLYYWQLQSFGRGRRSGSLTTIGRKSIGKQCSAKPECSRSRMGWIAGAGSLPRDAELGMYGCTWSFAARSSGSGSFPSNFLHRFEFSGA